MLAEGPGADAETARAAAEAKFSEWTMTKTEVFNAAYKLSDRRERIVIIDYFCNRMTVLEIAQNLNVTIRTAFLIKRSAIRHLGEVLGFE